MRTSRKPRRDRASRAALGRRAVTAAAVAAVPVVVAAPASAATRYPSTCPSPANAGDWTTNCWVGVSYDNFSASVLGVKVILDSNGDLTETRNSNFDSVTANDVKIYQSNQGIGIDGIVGHDTWNKMNTQLIYDVSRDGYNLYDAYGGVNLYVDRFRKHSASPTNWLVESFTYANFQCYMSYNNGSC